MELSRRCETLRPCQGWLAGGSVALLSSLRYLRLPVVKRTERYEAIVLMLTRSPNARLQYGVSARQLHIMCLASDLSIAAGLFHCLLFQDPHTETRSGTVGMKEMTTARSVNCTAA